MPKLRFSWSLRNLMTLTLLASFASLASCAKGGFNEPMSLDEDFVSSLAFEPTENLVPSVPVRPEQKTDEVYELANVKFGADPELTAITARVQLNSVAGSETVEMAGRIREDGSATLIDMKSLTEKKHRLTAEAYLMNYDECKRMPKEERKVSCNKIILNIHYKVGKNVVKKQFVSGVLAKPKTKESAGPNPTNAPPSENAAPPTSGAPTGQPVDTKKRPEDTPIVLEHPDNRDHLNPIDPDEGMDDEDEAGEYVGARRNEAVIDDLEELPEKPVVSHPDEAPSPKPSQEKPTEKPTPSKPEEQKPAQPPVESPPAQRPPQKQEPKPVKSPAEIPVAPAPSPSPVRKPEEKPAPPIPKPTPAEKPPEPKTPIQPPAETKPKPPPITPVIPDAPSKESYVDKLLELEKKLAPFVDLRGGGHAVDLINAGSLKNGTQMPESGIGYRLIPGKRDKQWGTGMMISLLQNAAAYFEQTWFKGTLIMIGDISQKRGGRLKGTSHKSHQNGLDVDIPYIGTDKFVSVIDAKGRIKPNFDHQKNWQFFRLVANQRIVQDGKKTTILNRIFVNPIIKKELCKWAESTDLLKDPFDADIMRRIQPWSAHHDHFHLRLRCSPHHPECRDQLDGNYGC